MRDLVGFLRARLDEDEAHAKMAFADHNDAGPEWSEIWSGAVELGDQSGDLLITNDLGVSRHIARHDPARVLAEVEAKRRIVAAVGGLSGQWCDEIGGRVLGLLALPYANHPDYREDWRP